MIALATRLEKPLDPSLGREKDVFAEAVVSRSVERDQLEREIEAAGADEIDQRLDARGDGALFPASDDRAIAPGSLRELVLRKAGTQPCLSDQVGASHDAECRARLDSVISGRYAS